MQPGRPTCNKHLSPKAACYDKGCSRRASEGGGLIEDALSRLMSTSFFSMTMFSPAIHNGWQRCRALLRMKAVGSCRSRIRNLGYRIVYSPGAQFTHTEKASRRDTISPAKMLRFSCHAGLAGMKAIRPLIQVWQQKGWIWWRCHRTVPGIVHDQIARSDLPQPNPNALGIITCRRGQSPMPCTPRCHTPLTMDPSKALSSAYCLWACSPNALGADDSWRAG